MTIDDKIRDEKVQYNINIEAAKMPALSSENIDRYEYFAGEEILISNQRQIIEQAKFEKQRKTSRKTHQCYKISRLF